MNTDLSMSIAIAKATAKTFPRNNKLTETETEKQKGRAKAQKGRQKIFEARHAQTCEILVRTCSSIELAASADSFQSPIPSPSQCQAPNGTGSRHDSYSEQVCACPVMGKREQMRSWQKAKAIGRQSQIASTNFCSP